MKHPYFKRLLWATSLLFFSLGLITSPQLQAADAEPAPHFKLPSFKATIDLNQYRGRLVYVDFWASWCVPCRKSFPWMTELQKKYGSKLKVIAINLDKERDDAITFLKETKPRFSIAFDPDAKVADQYEVQGMPSSYLIDPQGNIVSSHIGFRNGDQVEVEAKIDTLIQQYQL